MSKGFLHKVILQLFLCCNVIYPAWCQLATTHANRPFTRAITTDDGLSQGWIAAMLQDQQGFVWIASHGLSRYDGRSFIHYLHDAADTASIAGNLILFMELDHAGNLWIVFGDSKTIDVIHTPTGRIRHISSEPAFAWMQPIIAGTSIVRQLGGRYFLANGHVLIVFDVLSGNHQQLSLPKGERLLGMGNIPGKGVLVSTHKSLYRLRNTHLQKMISFPSFPEDDADIDALPQRPRKLIDPILADRYGKLVCPAVGGFFDYDTISKQCRYIGDHQKRSIGAMDLRSSPEGSIITVAGNSVYNLDEALQPQKMISSTDLLSEPFFFDQSGIFWVASKAGNGIRLLDLHPGKLPSYPYKTGFVQDLLQPYIGSAIKGLDVSSYVFRYAKDQSGHIWVICPSLLPSDGTPDYRHSILKLDSNRATAVNFKKGKPLHITFSQNNQCWLTMDDNGRKILGKVNLQNGTFYPFATFTGGADLLNGYLTTVGNKVCVVTEDTLLLYDTATAARTDYSSKKLALKGGLLMAVSDRNNRNLLWITTRGAGIALLDIRNGRITHFNESTGLPNNGVYGILQDRQGFLWCSSNKGIFRLDTKTGHSISFTVKDGLQDNEFNRYHFMETPTGHFAFGGTTGYTLFNPDSVHIDGFQTPVFISDILVNNQPLHQADATYKDSMISALEQLELTYDQNFLSINFAGLQYHMFQKMRYRYKMAGPDKDWIIAGPDAAARYTAISPGHYIFQVNASNSSGIWSNQIKLLKLTILPPWWRTWWAYTFYILITGLIMYALYRNWMYRTRAAHRIQLQQKEAEQLKAVDEIKNRFFSNITHEFRTPLSLIIGPVGQMLQQEPSVEWKKQIGVIDRNAKQMLLLINQLLDMAKLEAGSMKINFSRGNVYQFVQEEIQAFEAAATVKGITISLTMAGDHDDYLFDAEKIHAILSNLLSNAVKFTPAGGTISIQVNRQPAEDHKTRFSFIITDSGIGIAPEKLSHIFNRFYQVENTATRRYEGTGIGLALARELAALMGGTLVAESEPGKGSTFTLQISLLQTTDEQMPVYRPVQSLAPLPAIALAENGIPDEKEPLILVAEDNEELRTFIAQVFSREYRVLTASNGAEGLKMANEELPDLIISDLMMPEMGGYDFCKAIKTNPATNHIAFILLTAKSSPVSIVENLQNRADDYLTKPFNVEELRIRVLNIIERQAQLRLYYQKEFLAPKTDIAPTGVHGPAPLPDPFLEELHAIIEKHLDDTAFSVENFASKALMSKRTLNRKLSSLAGISGSELIKKYRLKKAAEFLSSGATVTETTYRVGYESPAHFSTMFKEFYGVPPSEYYTKRKEG